MEVILEPHAPPPRRRRWKRWVLAALILLAGAWLSIPLVVAPFVRDQLESLASRNLNGRLEIGTLSYRFPYSVRVTDARLVANADASEEQFPSGDASPGHRAAGESVDLFTVAEAQITLAKLPLGGGPLVIRRIDVKRPALHVVRAADGQFVGAKLIKTSPTTRPKSETRRQLSELFQLRKLVLDGGQVTFTDRTRAGVIPMLWGGLSTNLDIEPKSESRYEFRFRGKSDPTASVETTGDFDIDALELRVRELLVSAQVQQGTETASLPAIFQQYVQRYAVRGEVVMKASALIPFRELGSSTAESSLQIRNATARLPRSAAGIDRLSMHMSLRHGVSPPTTAPMPFPATQPVAASGAIDAPAARGVATSVTVNELSAVSGPLTFRLERGGAMVDPANGTWTVSDVFGRLTADPDVEFKPADPGVAGSSTRATRLGNLTTQIVERIGAGNVEFAGSASGALPKLSIPGSSGSGGSTPQPGTTRLVAARDDTIPPDIARTAATRAATSRPTTGPAHPLRYAFSAVARDLALRPPGFASPLEHITGAVDVSPLGVVVDRLSAMHGKDVFFLRTARIPLTNLTERVRIAEMSGYAAFEPPSPKYPKPFTELVEQLRPSGRIEYAGDMTLRYDGPLKLDYEFQLNSTTAGVAVLDGKIPATNLNLDARVTSDLIEIRKCEGDVLGGRIEIVGTARPRSPVQADVTARVSEIEVKELVGALSDADPGRAPTGRARGRVQLRVAQQPGRPLIDTLTGTGRGEVIDGDFVKIPVLSSVLGVMRLTRDAVTVGEGAAVFDIADQQIVLKKVLVTAPAVGVQGSGKVGFDGKLALHLVTAPLGDWRREIRQLRIPLISRAVGELAGGIQKILNSATSRLLYEFRVDGTVKQPNVAAVPAPLLTDSGARVFGWMLGRNQGEAVMDMAEKEVQAPPPTPTAPPPS